MSNKLMVSYFFLDLVFALTGALLLGFALTSEQGMRSSPTVENVARDLLLDQCPLTAAIVNAIFIFITFLLSLPVFFLPTSRVWLHIHAYLTVVCGIFSLCLGVAIWFSTLQTRSRLLSLWDNEPPLVQSLLQQRFDCCGYTNFTSPPFIQDVTCTNNVLAERKGGCIRPFSNFANQYLDQIFTALFGFVALDLLVILWVAMVLKHRTEQERYRHIDEKNGTNSF